MAIALFILGSAGTGKTQLSKKFIKSRIRQGESWCMLDKDTCGSVLSSALMELLGLDLHDRDSPEYMTKVRDLEYQTCLNLIREQLRLGVNVVVPGPWTKEINSGKLFSVKNMNFPEGTILKHVYLSLPEEKMHGRILNRNNLEDKWKLNNWEDYKKRLIIPEAIKNRNILTLSDRENNIMQLKMVTNLCLDIKLKKSSFF